MKKSLLLAIGFILAVSVSAGNLSGYRIGLDPGHGGSDPGASGPTAPHEATLCLRVVNALNSKLQGDGCGTMLTRSSDTYVGLSTRASKFTSYDPYIALSVHLNAANTTAYGTETWYCTSSGNSYSLASSMHSRMVACMRDGALGCATAPTKGGGTFARGVKQTCWTVIYISSGIPATLTEGLFIDNSREHSYLCSTSGFNAWMMGMLYGCYTHMNKCVNSNIPASPAGATTSLSVSPTSLSFGNVVKGKSLNKSITVSMSNISSATVSSSNNSVFMVSTGSVSNNGSVTIGFYAPATTGSYSGTITISGGGKTATVSCSGTSIPEPKSINPASTSASFSAVINQTQTKTINIGATNLTGNISVASSDAAFEVSPTSLAKTGGVISIKFKPTEVRNYAGTITLTSSGADTETISLTGKGTGIPINLVQGWNYSERNGLPAASDVKKGWASNPLNIRNFDYYSGALYVVNAAEGKITKVNAQTAETLGDLNMTGVSGGAIAVCDCKVISGKVIASNVTTNPATSAFKVYIWDSENVAPRVLLETTNAGTDVTRIGDCIGLIGDLTSGTLLFGGKTSAGKNVIVKFAITNGVCATTPTLQTMVDTNNEEMYFGNSVRVQSAGNDKYWCNGQNYLPTLFGSDSKMVTTLNPEAVDITEGVANNGNTAGNAFKAFVYGGVQYGVATRYNIVSSTTDGSTYKGGRFNLFDATEGWAKATKKGEYPAAGLGVDTRNINCASSLAVAVNGDDGLEIWVSVLGQGIAYFKHGTVPAHNPGTVTPSTDPAITLNPSGSTSFSAVATETQQKTVALTCANLTADVTVALSGTNADLFTLSTATVSKTGGSVVVTYKPTAAGSHTATLTVSSTGATATLTLNGTATKKTYFDDTVGAMEEVWNYSTIKGNTASAPWLVLSDVQSRDMTLLNNKLYILNAKAWGTTPEIQIVNAKTGTKTGALNITGISGGESILGSVKAFGGKIIASNGARTTDALKIYKWDSDAAAPAVWLEDATHGGLRGGEIMSVSGDMTSGRVIFSDGSNVFYYTVTNGTIATSPTVIALTKAGAAYNVGAQKGSIDVTFNTDGSFWATGKDYEPTLFNASGVYQGELSTAAVGGPVHGTSSRFFTFGTKKYAAVVTYLNKSNTSLAEGCFSLVDMTSGYASAERPNGMFPTAGLGTTRNTLFNSAVCQSVENMVLNVWVLVPFQGCAYFRFNGESENPPVAIEQVRNEAAQMVLYNHTETLFVEGIRATNIDLYTLTGQKIRTAKNSNELSVAGLQGVYVVVVKDNNNVMRTGKVIVK